MKPLLVRRGTIASHADHARRTGNGISRTATIHASVIRCTKIEVSALTINWRTVTEPINALIEGTRVIISTLRCVDAIVDFDAPTIETYRIARTRLPSADAIDTTVRHGARIVIIAVLGGECGKADTINALIEGTRVIIIASTGVT